MKIAQIAPLHESVPPKFYCGTPQAWAAGSLFMLLQAALGLRIEGSSSRISFSYPLLPDFLKEIRLLNLRVGTGSVDLLLQRHGTDVGVNVLRREGELEVVLVK
jgi:hypothetical protein